MRQDGVRQSHVLVRQFVAPREALTFAYREALLCGLRWYLLVVDSMLFKGSFCEEEIKIIVSPKRLILVLVIKLELKVT